MIDIRIMFDSYRASWLVQVKTPERSCGVLIDDWSSYPWWSLIRRWKSRQYRRRLSSIFAYTLHQDFATVDRIFAEVLKEKGIVLA